MGEELNPGVIGVGGEGVGLACWRHGTGLAGRQLCSERGR